MVQEAHHLAIKALCHLPNLKKLDIDTHYRHANLEVVGMDIMARLLSNEDLRMIGWIRLSRQAGNALPWMSMTIVRLSPWLRSLATQPPHPNYRAELDVLLGLPWA